MARKRYSAEQIIDHLRQAEILIAEGKTIGEAARCRGFMMAPFTWYCPRKPGSVSPGSICPV